MSDGVRPRINHSHLGSFINRDVILLGRVSEQDATRATIVLSDNKSVVVQKRLGSVYPMVVEVHGRVTDTGMLQESAFVEVLGADAFEMENYNTAVELSLSPQFAHLFQP
jgi:hypothetical protein